MQSEKEMLFRKVYSQFTEFEINLSEVRFRITIREKYEV
jgi:hypothetical protein